MARISDLERREVGFAAPDELTGLMAPGADVAARWDAAPMSARRQVVRILCAPGVLGELEFAGTRRERAPTS